MSKASHNNNDNNNNNNNKMLEKVMKRKIRKIIIK